MSDESMSPSLQRVLAADQSINAQFVGENPRFADTGYRVRRDTLAALSCNWQPGDAVPVVDYIDAEDEVWAGICQELAPRHERFACQAFVEAKESLGLPMTRIPQLTEVSERLAPHTGFRCIPASGLVPIRSFLGAYGTSCFYSTQFIRHRSMRLYTPEPDIVHELIGHANHLASPLFASIYRLVGQAVEQTRSDAALRFLSQVFWSTLELGVVRENGKLKAYGAGLLSSFGEMDAFRNAEIRPMDLLSMGTSNYFVRNYQSVLYAADSMSHLLDFLSNFFSTFDDDSYARLLVS